MIQSRIPAVSTISLIFSHKPVSVAFSGKYGPCIMLELVSMELLVEKQKDSSRELPLLLFSRILDFVSFVNSGFMGNANGCAKQAAKETQTKLYACAYLSNDIFKMFLKSKLINSLYNVLFYGKFYRLNSLSLDHTCRWPNTCTDTYKLVHTTLLDRGRCN